MNSHAGLAGRIGRSLGDLDRVIGRLALLVERAGRDSDFAVIDSLALNLQSLYTGLEQVFEAIAREVDEDLPSGPNWHRELLDQMGAELPGRRPAVLDEESLTCLHAARGFRHLVRNVYSHNLQADQVVDLTQRMMGCHRQVQRSLQAFAALLLSSA